MKSLPNPGSFQCDSTQHGDARGACWNMAGVVLDPGKVRSASEGAVSRRSLGVIFAFKDILCLLVITDGSNNCSY